MNDFFPPTEFVDVDTIGYENVKDETDVKLLRFSSFSPFLLAEKIYSFAKNPSVNQSKRITTEKDENSTKFRHAVLYSNVENLTNVLSITPTNFDEIKASPPKICFLITCQATQYSGMGKEVYGWSPVFRHYFDECDTLTKDDYGLSVKNLMNQEDSAWVNNPLQALPYILSLEYALYKLWESWGIKPDIILGMSFGEYGAAVFSGIISLKDAFKLIMTRTQLVTDHIKEEAFAAVEMDYSEFSKVMEELKNVDGFQDAWLDIACVNSPLQTCVVGPRQFVHKFVGM